MEIIRVFQSGSVLEIIAQIIGFLALAASVTSFQMKTYKQIIIVQEICAFFFVVHLGMLFFLGHKDAISGCVANIVCLIRNFVFFQASKKEEKRPWLKTLIFSIILPIVVACTWQSPVTLLCMVGMVLNTISFSMQKPQNVRRVILVASPFFFAYNFLSGSIGGAINEVISFTSAVVGLIRYRKKKQNEK